MTQQQEPVTTTQWARGFERFPARPGVLKVNLIVADIDRALVFYEKVFGVREVMRIMVGGLVEVLVGDGATTSLALIRLPGPAAQRRSGPAMNAIGVNAPFPLVTLTVDDLDRACERLAAAGGTVLHPPAEHVQIGAGQTGRIAIGTDPDGNPLELLGFD